MGLLVNWNVLCWNIRGLNSGDKQLALSNAINASGCSVLCLQETKKPVIDHAFIKSCCPRRFDQFAFVPSRGASGGILTIWKSSVFSGTVVSNDTHVLVTTFVSTQSSQSWTLANVYGPCAGEERDIFTNWLYDVNIPNGQDWLLLGDFNYMRAPDNRNKPGGNLNDMITFNDIIRKQQLIEIPVQGRTYTWSNMQLDPLLEQIDWFLTSLHWTNTYPKTLVKPLGKPVSNHIPCVVTIETKIHHSKLFRFESYWILHPGFMDIVQELWNTPVFNKNAAATLAHKFKALRHALKIWSKHISKLSIAISNCNEVLADLDELENKICLTIPESNFRNILKAHLLKMLKYQKLYWKKCCTIRWIKFGDENTNFFQAIAT